MCSLAGILPSTVYILYVFSSSLFWSLVEEQLVLPIKSKEDEMGTLA